jgi:flagellar hook protein FlgE
LTIGNFKQTGVNTDLAIQGRGLFILKDPITGANLYTRDGQFRLSRDGYLVNSGGFFLQGFRLNERGEVVGTGLEAIRVEQQLQPKATNSISFIQPTNLDANAVIPSSNTFNPYDVNSYNYKYTITIYDTLGNPYQADIFFKKSATNIWQMFILADYDGDGNPENLISDAYRDGSETDASGNTYNFVRLVFDDQGNLMNLSNDRILTTTIGNKRYYYFNLFDSSNPPPEGLNTESGGRLGGQVDLLGLTDPSQMVFVLGDEATIENVADVPASTTPTTDNFTGDGTTRTFQLTNFPVVIGSVNGSADIGGVPVSFSDDGTGNLVDGGGNVIGKVDYTKGIIQFFTPPDSGGSVTINYSFGSYDGDNSAEDIIKNTYINQFAANFLVTADQNGYTKGDLIDVYVLSEDGSVVGVYSNGESLPLYRVALAVFGDPEELTKKGANLYTSITTPTILLAGGSEKVRSGMLEMSNVDIAKEFINLITAQRAYQANARVITTSNTILDETVNLVR